MPLLSPARLALAVLAGLLSSLRAQQPPEPVRARLVAPAEALVAGTDAQLGVLLDLADGWHVYGRVPSDSGMPVELAPSWPAGWEPLPAEWPAPARHAAAGDLLDHVYAGRVLLPLAVRVPESAAGTQVTLRVHASWMACRSVCLLGEADLELPLRVAEPGATPPPGNEAPHFLAARQRQPRPLPAQGAPLSAEVRDGALRLHAPGIAGLVFYPDADGPGLLDLLRDGEVEGERLILRLRAAPAPATAVRGVVELRWPGSRPADFYRIDVPLPVSFAPGSVPRAPSPLEKDDAH